jgi:PAB1-binding protein PBP1
MNLRVSGGVAVCVAAALVASAPAVAQAPAAERSVPIDKVFPYYDRYLKLPAADRTRWALSYRIDAGGKPATGVKLAYRDAGGARTPITVAPDGRMEPLPTLAQFAAGTTVAVSAPPETKFGVSLDIVPRMAPAARMDARELAASADQATKGAKKAAGLIGLAVPRFERVVFPGATGGTVETPGGARPLPTLGANRTPYFEPKAWPGATAVAFETAPTRMLLAPAGK